MANAPITHVEMTKDSVKSNSSKQQISEDLSQLRALGKFTDRENSKNLLTSNIVPNNYNQNTIEYQNEINIMNTIRDNENYVK